MTTPYDKPRHTDGMWSGSYGIDYRRGQQAAYLRGVAKTEARYAVLVSAAEQAREAFRLTREYVGEGLLPAIEGWSWYDADMALYGALKDLADLEAKKPEAGRGEPS